MAMEQEAVSKKQWRGYTVDELREMRKPEWSIQGVLPKRGTGVVFGKSGIGKSFLLGDMAWSVATGRDWQGHHVTQGQVIYVAMEQPRGYGMRLRAWEKHTQQQVGPDTFHLIETRVDLLSEADVESFITHIQEEYGTVRLVVLDTLSKSMGSLKDENSNAEMARAVAGMERIAQDLDAMVVAVHHTGKDGKSARGAYALECNTDVRIRIDLVRSRTVRKAELKPGDIVEALNEHQKDDEPFAPIRLRAEMVSLEDGDSSLILVDADAGPKRKSRTNTARQRQTVLTMASKGIPAVEIAAKLDMNPATVRSIISRDRTKTKRPAA